MDQTLPAENYKFGPASLISECNEGQLEIVKKFRNLVVQHFETYESKPLSFYVQWLVARDWQIDAAMKMIEYFEEFKAISPFYYNMTEKSINMELDQYIPGVPIGRSKAGHPVIYAKIGQFDVIGLKNCVTFMEFINHRMRYVSRCYKLCEQESLRTGLLVDQIYGVIDFGGFSVTSMSADYIGMSKVLGEELQNIFPEIMAKVFLVNAKSFIVFIFNLFSHIMTERVKSKIHVLDGSGIETLSHYIERSQIPEEFGGDSKSHETIDGSPNAFVEPSPFPHDMYKKAEWERVFHDPTMTEVHLSRREDVLIEVGTSNRLSYVNWVLVSEHHDVAFTVAFRGQDESKDARPTNLHQPTRINCHLVPERGYFPTKWEGTYFILIDNKFSRFNGKKVRYKVHMSDQIL